MQASYSVKPSFASLPLQSYKQR